MTNQEIITELEEIELGLVEASEEHDEDNSHRIEMLGWAMGLLSTPADPERMPMDAEEAVAVVSDMLEEMVSDYEDYTREEKLEDEGNMMRQASALWQARKILTEMWQAEVNK